MLTNICQSLCQGTEGEKMAEVIRGLVKAVFCRFVPAEGPHDFLSDTRVLFNLFYFKSIVLLTKIAEGDNNN